MQVAQLKTHSLKKHNEIRKRNAKFTKKTLKKEETLETFAPTKLTDNYRVSKVKLDETKQLFRTENIKRYFLIISYFQFPIRNRIKLKNTVCFLSEITV